MISARRAGELAAVGIGLAVFGYLAWDGAMWDPRLQLALHLAGVAVVAGMAWIALAGGALPRSRLELPLLALLLAFAVAGLSAWNPGLTAGALAAIVANALMLPAAALALRHRPGWTVLLVTGLVLALAGWALFELGARRLDWFLAGGPGLPPLRLGRETTVFGSVAVAPFVLMAILPLALLIQPSRLRFWTLIGLAMVGLPLSLLSGSRSAWLAIAAATVVLLAPIAVGWLRGPSWGGNQSPGNTRSWGGIPRQGTRWRGRWTPRGVALTALAVATLVIAVGVVVPRLADLRSLVYRGFLWRDTLAAWSQDSLFGIGPGSMPFARQAAAPPLSFPVRQPHSHDIPLGILGDAGLVGVAAALVLFVTFVVLAGPWRTRTLPGQAAFAVLMGFAVGMLFEDLTFLPGFNLLVLLLVALALADAGAIRWQPMRLAGRLPMVAAPAIGAVALLVVFAFTDSAAVAYRQGTDAAAEGRWPDAYDALRRAEASNPWHPTAPKALAVAADRVGQAEDARAAASRAVSLSPGDGQSWTNLALLCREAEDRDCAQAAAGRAVDTASAGGPELANAALVYEWLGEAAAADRAYRLSLLTTYWTGLTLPWPRPVAVGDGGAGELGIDAAELNLLIARRLNGEPVRADDYAGQVTRALAAAMIGERELAEAEIERAVRVTPDNPTAWEIAALLTGHYGGDPSQLLRIGDAVRGVPLAIGTPRPPGVIYDIATFRAYPVDGLVAAAERLLPEVRWPWVLEPLLAPASQG